MDPLELTGIGLVIVLLSLSVALVVGAMFRHQVPRLLPRAAYAGPDRRRVRLLEINLLEEG
ncbi:MAG: hypothetical protein ACHQ0J_13540 [Candidatus Dormibacterales bacterium]